MIRQSVTPDLFRNPWLRASIDISLRGSVDPGTRPG